MTPAQIAKKLTRPQQAELRRFAAADDTAREKLRAIGITFWDEEPRHAD